MDFPGPNSLTLLKCMDPLELVFQPCWS